MNFLPDARAPQRRQTSACSISSCHYAHTKIALADAGQQGTIFYWRTYDTGQSRRFPGQANGCFLHLIIWCCQRYGCPEAAVRDSAGLQVHPISQFQRKSGLSAKQTLARLMKFD